MQKKIRKFFQHNVTLQSRVWTGKAVMRIVKSNSGTYIHHFISFLCYVPKILVGIAVCHELILGSFVVSRHKYIATNSLNLSLTKNCCINQESLSGAFRVQAQYSIALCFPFIESYHAVWKSDLDFFSC